MTQPYRILFVKSNLGGGGAERALLNLVNQLDRERFEPHIALFQKAGVFLPSVKPDVPINEIQPKDYGFVHRTAVRMHRIKEMDRRLKPHLIMSLQWQANIGLVLAKAWVGLSCPVVLNEQNMLSFELSSQWQRRLFWPLARRYYATADKIVAISQGIADELHQSLEIPLQQLVVIPNPVDFIGVQALVNQPSRPLPNQPGNEQHELRHPCLVAVGRLAPQKNYPLLLRAMRQVIDKLPFHLYILGEGKERPRLEAMISDLSLGNYAHLLGFQENPFAIMRQADGFVLSSDYEGFGNVIVEALALGLPVIATDCPSGPAEILENGRFGLLVPPGNETALAHSMDQLLNDLSLRRRFSATGPERARQYAIENITERYEELFASLIEVDHGRKHHQ